MIVVDSSVWISLLKERDTDAVRKLRRHKPKSEILVGDLIMLEVLQGARSDAAANRLEAALRSFATAEMLDGAVAVLAAKNYRALRAYGFTIRKTVDLIIATFCLDRGHTLLHEDRDFEPFERHLGLRCL